MSTHQQIDKTRSSTATRTKESKPQSGTHPAQILQRLENAPGSIGAADVLQLQRAIGNRATERILQAKLKLGPVGDAYEQEADRVAQQVVHASRRPDVQRADLDEDELQAKPLAAGISRVQRTFVAPPPMPKIQREEMDEDELQAKPLAAGISQAQRVFVTPPKIQREEMDEEIMQAKPLAAAADISPTTRAFTASPQVQRHHEDEELQASPLHGLEGGDVDDSVARTIESAKGGGQSLHDGVRSSMERGFGADFSGVRVHTGGESDALNRSLNARAFTTGKDIFFGKGQYNPGSSGGQELIAHELTHTVQQGAAGVQSVQRLMSLGAFKTATPGSFRGRSGVAAIDTLLQQYEALGGSPQDIKTRKTRLIALKQACDNYAGNRAQGVSQLGQTVVDEQSYIDPLADAVDETAKGNRLGYKTAFQRIFQGQDAYLVKKRAGHPDVDRQMPDFSKLISDAQIGLGQIGERASVMQELILEDVQRLEQLAQDNSVPLLLRQVLVEVLANKDDTYFQETMGVASGAVLAGQKDRQKGITEKYRLDMQMNQKEGSPERLSSLVHEMTHIATQEKFQNTVIHLAFDKNAQDNDILDLSRERTQQLTTLGQRLTQTQNYWSPMQLSVLQEKVAYPVNSKNTLTSYANTFFNKGEIIQQDYDRIIRLANAGANNTLIEFDTVINQMLFLMNVWQVPQDNAFYTELTQVAQEAYNHRHS